MYNFIQGKVVEKDIEKNLCVVEVNGIGYEIIVPESSIHEINLADEIKFYIVEISGGLYSGGLPNLYGFLSKEEKEVFLAFKDNLPNVGPKKALEYLDKVKKNITQFKTAIRTKNYKLLISLFGFKHSSAEKIISALGNLEYFVKEGSSVEESGIDMDIYTDIVSALTNLGYKETEIKKVVEKVLSQHRDIYKTKKSSDAISELITLAIKELSTIK